MKFIIVCLLLCLCLAQNFDEDPRKSSSEIEFDNGRELLRFMHLQQHKMEDHYIKQVATMYIFYSPRARDEATRREIESDRLEIKQSIQGDSEKAINMEEIIIEDNSYDSILDYYNTTPEDLEADPLVLIDEFDERVWVYHLSQTKDIKNRLKAVLAEGVSFFNN